MSIERYYFEEHDFLVTKMSDELTDQSFIDHMLKLNEEVGDVTGLRQLTDCRQLTKLENLSIEGLINVLEVSKLNFDSRLAVLVPADNAFINSVASTYRTFAQKKREVEIFSSVNEALDWLARDENEKVLIGKKVVRLYSESEFLKEAIRQI